jgi:hypothetical protein
MPFSIVDPELFLTNGVFREDGFLKKAEQFNWNEHKDKQVLVRGCSSAIFPPWAFMYITGKLTDVAKSVRYGNEHDNIVVFRKTKNKTE